MGRVCYLKVTAEENRKAPGERCPEDTGGLGMTVPGQRRDSADTQGWCQVVVVMPEWGLGKRRGSKHSQVFLPQG
jgi:hypothetical protein